MRDFLRGMGALGLFLACSSGAMAANSAPISSLDWMEPCSLPSALASDEGAIPPGEIRLIDFEESAMSCDDHCAIACDDGCCDPEWIVSAGAVFLHRSRPASASIATPPTGTPGTLINGGDFQFNWEAGPEISIARRSRSGIVWEGRYFGINDSDAGFFVPAVTTFRVAGIGVTILGGGSIDGIYDTRIDSTEFNANVPINAGCSFIAGFRAVELHDNLRLNIATPNTFVNWDENNHLYGGQLGVKMNFISPGSPLDFTGAFKAGIYGNLSENAFTSNIVGGDTDSTTDVAFVGELNLSAAYHVTQHLALRGGYMVLWLENVGLASDVAATTVQTVGGTSSPARTDGSLWYHGATVAVEYIW